MKIFIFENLEKITGNWHPEGGCAVIAENIERAMELMTEKGWEKDDKDSTPEVYGIESEDERVIIFPNSGCC